jgi:hypothetical protein
MFSAIVLSLSILSCKNENSGNNSQKAAAGEKSETITITQTKVDVVDKIEPGKIENVTLSYSELTLDNEDLGNTTETLKSGSELYLNGCNIQKIKNIKIKGFGNHLTLTIKSPDGAVIFEKKDFTIDRSITLTEKDKIEIGSLSVAQAGKILFTSQLLVSGCN